MEVVDVEKAEAVVAATEDEVGGAEVADALRDVEEVDPLPILTRMETPHRQEMSNHLTILPPPATTTTITLLPITRLPRMELPAEVEEAEVEDEVEEETVDEEDPEVGVEEDEAVAEVGVDTTTILQNTTLPIYKRATSSMACTLTI